MNKDEIRAVMPVIEAYLEGKTVQVRQRRLGGSFADLAPNVDPGFLDSYWEWRIKPEVRTVPLTEPDIPPTCWLRSANPSAACLVIAVREDGVRITNSDGVRYISYKSLHDCKWWFSADRQTWRPCSKEVCE